MMAWRGVAWFSLAWQLARADVDAKLLAMGAGAGQDCAPPGPQPVCIEYRAFTT